METVPLLREGKTAGEITVQRDGLYLRLSARAALPEGLWCVWLVGEQGEFRLGIPEPQGRESALCRRISARTLTPLGRLLRGEARPLNGQECDWKSASKPACLFRDPCIQKVLERCGGALVRRAGEQLFLALPYQAGRPFPLVSLFCFARICGIRGREYAVFAFDGAEQPVFSREQA